MFEPDEGKYGYWGYSHEEDENGGCRTQDGSDMDGKDDVDEADGATGDGNRFGSDEEDNYCYDNHVDDSNEENSKPKLDLTDDTLGPKDGEREGDEMYLLGFAAL